MMARYEKYKDSGIEWIGEIPAHWEVKKLKYVLKDRLKYGANEPAIYENQSDPRYIRITDFDNNGSLRIDTFKSLPIEIAEEYLLSNGDILFARSGATVGKTFQFKNYEGIACFAGYLIKASPNQAVINSDYLYCFTKSSFYKRWKESTFNQATIQNIGADKYAYLEIPLPKIEEQNAIANYLDRKTAEMDELIAKKERLIALYEEEKTALINQVVTKGLNPDVEMKDSGVEWLGEVPAHWAVKKLKYVVTKVGSGITPRGGANVYQLSGIPLLRSQNIHFEGFRLDDVAYISEEVHDNMANSKVMNGDVLLNITGASIGRCYYVNDVLEDANVNQHVCIIRPNSDILTKFLYFLLRSVVGQEQINREQTGSGREGLNFEALKNFFFPSLGYEEQIEIVTYLENRLSEADFDINKTKRLIDLLKEYRFALISEAVTGKIRVG